MTNEIENSVVASENNSVETINVSAGEVTEQFQLIPVTEIYADLDRNFRDPNTEYDSCQPTENYDDAKYVAGEMQRGLFESVYYEGVKNPVWLALLPKEDADRLSEEHGRTIKYRVIRGHRRMVTVENVNKHYPGHITEVRAIVYSNLSIAQEWDMLADHGGVNKEQDLSDIGKYRATIKLFGSSQFSQERIGNILGESRGSVMRRIWVHKMKHDTPVETEYLKQFDKSKKKGEYYSFTSTDIEALHKAWMADESSNTPKMSPEAEFKKAWDKFTGTSKAASEGKSLTRQKLDERKAFVQGSPPLQELFNFASGRGGSAEKARELYDQVHKKAEKADELKKENSKLVKAEKTATEERDAAIQRVAELTAELDAVKAELDAVKAELDAARKATSNRKGR